MIDLDSRIQSDLILKLFDTLKESNKDVKVTVDRQTDAIVHLSSLIKEGVKPEDLKKILEDYHSHSGQHLDDIDTCTESIQDNSGKILTMLKGMSKKVNTMIMVVVISFALMTISYMFVSSSVETMIKKEIKESVKIEENYIVDDHSDIAGQIEELRKMVQRFHGEK